MDPNIQKMIFKYRHFTQKFLAFPNLKQEAFKYFLSHFFWSKYWEKPRNMIEAAVWTASS